LSIEKKSFLKRTGRFSAATIISRMLGLLREASLAAVFGATGGMDAFVAAFRIPNLLRDLFAEGALSAAYIPVFTEKLKREGTRKALLITSSIFSIILAILGLIVILGIVLAPYFVRYYVSGFDDPDQVDLTIKLARIMFPFILLVAFAAVSMGTLNSLGRFGIPALAPAVFNLIMIVSALYLTRFMHPPIIALGIGAVAGGVGQFVIQIPQLIKVGFKFRFKMDFKDESVRRIFKLMLPAALGVAAWQVNVVVSTLLASYLEAGSISNLYYALRLVHFPLGVFGVALAAVSLPEVSALVSSGDIKGAAEAQRYSSKMVLFLLMPSAAYLMGAAEAIVSAAYQRGSFAWTDTLGVAVALRAYALGLVFFGLVRVTAQVFYAFKDTITPVKISLITVAVNVALSLLFLRPLGFAGLALATSLSSVVNFSFLYYLSGRKAPRPDRFGLAPYFAKMLLCSLLSGFAAYLVARSFQSADGFGGFGRAMTATVLSALAAGITFFLTCSILKIKELTHIKEMFSGRR